MRLREFRLNYESPFRVETHSYGIPGVNGYAKVVVLDMRSQCRAEAEGTDQPDAKRRALDEVWETIHDAALAEDAKR